MGSGTSKTGKHSVEAGQESDDVCFRGSKRKLAQRRGSVSAQGNRQPNDHQIDFSAIPSVPKSTEQLARIHACIKANVLFRDLTEEYTNAVINSMKEYTHAAGEYVITQGQMGDFWYVVDSGELKCLKYEQGEETPGREVYSYGPGMSFGELALMYNQRRAASVVAVSDTVLWAVDQTTFQTIMMQAALTNEQTYCE
mmetsp:Transcript_69580/g.115615  ORF Transcript_69580/g.115615 Transcript_69580/m.115615 type:complete len:197 (+) Transcript_69580:54-644(+)